MLSMLWGGRGNRDRCTAATSAFTVWIQKGKQSFVVDEELLMPNER